MRALVIAFLLCGTALAQTRSFPDGVATPIDLAAVSAKMPTVTQIARTTTPISVPMPNVSVVAAALLSSVTVTVPGVAVGDFVQATFAGSPPTGLTIAAAVATAANTVVVTFAATGALTLAAGPQSLQFCWVR